MEDKWFRATEELCHRSAITARQAEAPISALMTEVGKLIDLQDRTSSNAVSIRHILSSAVC